MTNPTTGLVLTGGSLKGICAQTGLLMALDEANYKVDAIIGTSAGALVGGFYASGKSGMEIYQILREMVKSDYIDPDWKRLIFSGFRLFKGWHGLMKGEALLSWLKDHLTIENLEECQIPLYITVTNVSREMPEIKNTGPLAELIRASTAIPLSYQMQKIGNEYFVDGGACNNNPLDELVERRPDLERFIIGTSLTVDKPLKDIDSSFLTEKFTPIKMIDKIIAAIGTGLRQENMEHGNKDLRILKINPGKIGLDEPEKIDAAIIKAFYHATQLIQDGALD